MTNPDGQLSFSIINTEMTVEAMRDSGYKSTTHALAELIDNAIEAGATAIEVFGISGRNDQTGRTTLKELAVLDNGEGMDEVRLRGEACAMGTEPVEGATGSAASELASPTHRCRKPSEWMSGRGKTGATNALHTSLSISDVESGAEEIPEAHSCGLFQRRTEQQLATDLRTRARSWCGATSTVSSGRGHQQHSATRKLS